ncbi:MAG: hypothetical protein IIT59_02250, partial [Rhodocyclaceae bacterium]|nr:hypothetical protein [Rhodocyclaceae bacterium]
MTDLPEQGHFALFALPVRFRLDEAALNAAWRTLQTQFHPDRAAHLSMKFFKTEENFSKNATDTIWLKEQPLEKISITSNDGLNLVAFTLPAETAVGTVVLVHGYHSEPFREYAVLARMYHNLGYNIVMPYHRTHGESEGKYITFGIKERFDILEWVKKANSMYGSDKP